MAHYAKIDENNIVTKVLVIDEETVNSGAFGNPLSWIQTSYNTHGGQHSLGGTPFRKNYAGIGYTFDATRDAFIAPQSLPSWILNEDTCRWKAPVARPDDGKFYSWNEETKSWVELI